MDTQINEQQYEDYIKRWCQKVRNSAKQRAASFTKGKKETTHTYLKGRYAGTTEKKLKDNITFKLQRNYGEISRVSFLFPVHGIFRAYGVGNGQPLNGEPIRPRIRRSPSDWISAPINDNIKTFSNFIAEYHADKVAINVFGNKNLNINV